MIEWPGYSGRTNVQWEFERHEDDATFVSISETGFRGSPEEMVKRVADSIQGFTLVLAGLKALLEHDVHLNLVADRYPKGIVEG